MAILRVKSSNQDTREYRKIVGPVSKASATTSAKKASEQGYYSRVTPYKGQWAAWTTGSAPWSSKGTGASRKYVPRIGTYFKAGTLKPRMLKSGWLYEGSGSSLSPTGKVTEGDISFIDEKRNLWLWIYLKPYKDGGKVVRVERKRWR